jgi:phosphohistidine phosphatase
MKQLLLMRHAKSAYPADAADDFDRPLNRRGEDDAPHMGRLLADHGPRPDLIVSSLAQRARQTAQAVAAGLGYPEVMIRYERRLYLAAAEVLGETAAHLPEVAGTVLVIAHNPGLQQWLQTLCGGEVRLPTAAVAAIELLAPQWSDIKAGRGQLQWLVTPRLVRALS